MTVTKYHLSASGQMAPCEAQQRACPRPGHIDLNDADTWDNMFQARANVSPKYTPKQNMEGVTRHVRQVEYLATRNAARRILGTVPEGERLKLARFLDQIVRETPTSRRVAQQVFDDMVEDNQVDYAQGQGVTRPDPNRRSEQPVSTAQDDEYESAHERDNAELAERWASQADDHAAAVDELAAQL